ncbi:hypothetical protein AeRB84_010558 [Aphanomyces euteiches]|nr:hypothetical protein AeRB84_010558 [Aphanomyces euteiches]
MSVGSLLDFRLNYLADELCGMLTRESRLIESRVERADESVQGIIQLTKGIVDTLPQVQLLARRSGTSWSENQDSVAKFVEIAQKFLLRCQHQLGSLTLHTLQHHIDTGRRIEALEAKLIEITTEQRMTMTTSFVAASAEVEQATSSPTSSRPIDTTDGAGKDQISVDFSQGSNSDFQGSNLSASDEESFSDFEEENHGQDFESDSWSDDGSPYAQHFATKIVTNTVEACRYGEAFSSGLCDHLYANGDRCEVLRSDCRNYQSGSHYEQCRWVTTKKGARCKSPMEKCHHHNWWRPIPAPGTLQMSTIKFRPETPKPPGRENRRIAPKKRRANLEPVLF